MSGVDRLLLSNQVELLCYAMQLTGDESDAWDLLQETSVRILMHAGCYSEQGSFLAWAGVVMRRVFYNRQKGQARQMFLFGDSLRELDDTPLAVAAERSDSVYLTNEMFALIERLPAHQAKAFRLFIDGYSYADIAAAMSVSVDNVRNYIHAARVALRKMLGRD